MYDIGELICVASVEEAISALAAHPDSRMICGGTDLLVSLRAGKHAGSTLVSIHDLAELRGVRLDAAGSLHIGPGTCFCELTQNELIGRYVPVLGRAVDLVGGPQIRRMGTIGGNICNGAVSADSLPSLLALNAQLTLRSSKGTRRLPLSSFHLGPGRVDLRPTELLTDIMIRRADYEGFGGCYIKYAMREAMDIATISVAAVVNWPRDPLYRRRSVPPPDRQSRYPQRQIGRAHV